MCDALATAITINRSLIADSRKGPIQIERDGHLHTRSNGGDVQDVGSCGDIRSKSRSGFKMWNRTISENDGWYNRNLITMWKNVIFKEQIVMNIEMY